MTEPTPAPLVAASTGLPRARRNLIAGNPVLFAEYILRNEVTGLPFRLAPVQREWFRLIRAQRNPKLLLWAPPGSGKTQLLGVAYSLWILGNNPQARIAILGNTVGQAEKTTRLVKEYIEHGKNGLREIFPNLLPSSKWTDGMFHVQRKTASRSPSMQAIGIGGSFTGDRIDYLLCDDILDFETTYGQAARDKIWEWYKSTVPDRLEKTGASQIFIFNAWDEDDLVHRIRNRLSGWTWRQYPICDENETPLMPELFSAEQIATIRGGNTTASEFARKYLCKLLRAEHQRIKDEFIAIAMAAGRGQAMLERIEVLGEWGAFTGVDLGIGRKKTNDLTALATILQRQDGFTRIVNVESGRWSGPDIRDKVIEKHDRFHSIVGVESVAAQAFIVHFTSERRKDVPVRPFDTTGAKKEHPEFGIEAMGVRMSNGGIAIPNVEGRCHPEVEALVDGMRQYRPGSHVADAVIAFWIALETARMAKATTTLDVIVLGGRQRR